MYAADARHGNQTLQDKLQALYRLRSGGKVTRGFSQPYRNLLRAFDEPHKHLPPVIHVAGTNGKGSVIAMLRAILEQAGYKVHVYTSPHLQRFNERIVLAGQEIDDQALETLLDEALRLNNGAPASFFEVTTAMAFTVFARNPADIALLETGMGGRLDCTNIIENPLCTVITRIGYDHMEYLGNTLADIAGEKAGIMKPGAPCVIGPQDDEAVTAVFEARAAALGIPLIPAQGHERVRTNLTGPHQQVNAATALSCIKQLKSFEISKNDTLRGLNSVSWPGRLQRVTNGSLCTALPHGVALWYDGGHNESAGHALAAQAALWQEQDGQPLYLAVGMMRRKDPVAFLAPLRPYITGLVTLGIAGEPDACAASELAAMLNSAGLPPATPCETINDINDLNFKTPARLLLTGSLYLASTWLTG